MPYAASLLSALLAPHHDAIDFYDRIAEHYDRLHQHWLEVGGERSIAAILGCAAHALRPQAAVLDAGCGTGRLARLLQAIEPSCALTLVDAAPRMLERARVQSATTRLGDIRALPFEDASFDIVVCTWALETLAHGRAVALGELTRVLKPGGVLCYCVCSRAASRWTRLRRGLLHFGIERWFFGRFLRQDEIDPLGLADARRLRFHGGLSTVVIYNKALAHR